MRNPLIGVAALIALTTSPAWAADYEQPVDLPAGTKIDLTIQRTRRTARMPAPMTMTFRYRQDVEPTPLGYRVRQKMTGIDLPDSLGEAERRQLEQVTAVVAEIAFETDEFLAPQRVADWQAMSDRVANELGKTMPQQERPAIEAVKQTFAQMTPEVAARTFLREQAMTAAPQGTSLDLKKPVSAEQVLPNPLGGPPIKGRQSIELESLDKAKGRAVIVSRQALDPDSARASLTVALAALAEKMPDAPKPTKAELDGLTIERTTVCRSEMDIATGLALSTDCTQVVSGVDGSGRRQSQSDRWVITQALVRP